MSLRTLVGSYNQGVSANGAITIGEHVVFAYESRDQNRSWKIKEMQVWLNPCVESGGDSRTLLNVCLSTDFLSPPNPINITTQREYANQYNASDNRGIAWAQIDYQNRDASVSDYRVPAMGNVPHAMIADGRRAINYLILNSIIQSEGVSISEKANVINYRIIMESEKISPEASIFHQVRGMAQDVDTNRPN